MNLITKLSELCLTLERLKQLGHDSRCKENIDSVFLAGEWSETVGLEIAKLTSLALFPESELFRLKIDEDVINISEFVAGNSGLSRFSWELTFRKPELTRLANLQSEDIETVFFTSESAFLDNLSAVGLKAPFYSSKFSSGKPFKIIINGLSESFGGPRLAVVPVLGLPDSGFWLKGSELPDTSSLRKDISIVSEQQVYLSPQSFELSWGAVDASLAYYFKVAYLQQLLACFSQHFFSIEKIQLKGVKHLECSIASEDGFSISFKELNDIRDAVVWCFKDNDSNTRVQLIVDRISLELSDSSNFLSISGKKLPVAFEQAKSKYKYVVSKRNEDYRKELRELYADVKQLVGSYVEKTSTLIDGLMKDVLSIAFLFTVGTFAKAFVQSDVLFTEQASYFFKAAGLYLFFAYFIRRIHCQFVLSDNKKNLSGWVTEQYTHIPVDELNKKVEKLLKSPRRSFEIMAGIIASLYIVLIVIAFNMTKVLDFIGFVR